MHQYLNFAWKERNELIPMNENVVIGDWEGKDNLFNNVSLPLITPAIPQQNNTCDCGPFMLENAEQFLRMVPHLKPITEDDVQNNFPNNFGKVWFPSQNISKSREDLGILIDNQQKAYDDFLAAKSASSGANEDDDDESIEWS